MQECKIGIQISGFRKVFGIYFDIRYSVFDIRYFAFLLILTSGHLYPSEITLLYAHRAQEAGWEQCMIFIKVPVRREGPAAARAILVRQ